MDCQQLNGERERAALLIAVCKHNGLRTACVLHLKWTAAGYYNTRIALAPGVEPRLQRLLKCIQRSCRFSIHVEYVDGLRCINVKLNLPAGFVQVFLYCFQGYVVCTEQISHLGNHPRWERGKRYHCSFLLQNNFFYLSNKQKKPLLLAGFFFFFAVTVYWKILGSLFSLSCFVPCQIG